jgi:DNA-binding NarL/FixJ family response regulator
VIAAFDARVLLRRAPGAGAVASLARWSGLSFDEVRAYLAAGKLNELIVAVESGCCGFITKNGAVDELAASVRTAHAGGALIPPDLMARVLPDFQRDSKLVTAKLTARERQIMQLVAKGASNQAIAERLGISLHTVRNHVQRIITKLGAHSKLEAVAEATRLGFLPPEPSHTSAAAGQSLEEAK